MYYCMPSFLNCMWQVRDRVTAVMCCLGKIAELGVFLTWNVRLPPRGPGWDLLYICSPQVWMYFTINANRLTFKVQTYR